jgi:DNA-binding NtrC family response regulator
MNRTQMTKAKLPNILIFDEELAVDEKKRKELCEQALIIDSNLMGENNEETSLALAHFCSGQTTGAKKCNDYGIIKKFINLHETKYWSFALVNVNFKTCQSSNANAFGIEIRDKLQKDFPGLPVILFTSSARQDIKVEPEHRPYLNKKDITERKIRESLLTWWSNLNVEQKRHLLQLKADEVAFAPDMLDVFRKAYIHADDGNPILIWGESGVGKEVLARYIHRVSPRGGKPFKALNMAALPETVAESELFGYKKGAFTGAEKDTAGLFESAEEGTLFLDEIGELPLSVQAKLLRVIQEKEIRPVGSQVSKKIDVNLILASNVNFGSKVRRGEFRQDLLMRISTIPLQIPPLRQRPEDIIPMADFFLKDAMIKQNKKGITYADDARPILSTHKFPGNVRELQHLVYRLVGSTGDYDWINKETLDEAIKDSSLLMLSDSLDPEEISVQKSICHANPQVSLTDLPEILTEISIHRDLKIGGLLPKLEDAYRGLVKRLVGMAVHNTLRSDGQPNLQGAMKLLTKMQLTGRQPASQLKKFVPDLSLPENGENRREILKKLAEDWSK